VSGPVTAPDQAGLPDEAGSRIKAGPQAHDQSFARPCSIIVALARMTRFAISMRSVTDSARLDWVTAWITTRVDDAPDLNRVTVALEVERTGQSRLTAGRGSQSGPEIGTCIRWRQTPPGRVHLRIPGNAVVEPDPPGPLAPREARVSRRRSTIRPA